MPAFTVLVPTHDHVDTLAFSLESILRQSRQDFEVLVVGDGAPARTAEVVGAIAMRDSRVHYLPYPKGERHGESYRHDALRQAGGRVVCYLADDDLWFPDHLDRMEALLERADLAHVMSIAVTPDGQTSTGIFNAASDPHALERMRHARDGFGLSSGGHTMAAYRRLPHGWRPAPRGIASDSYFWLQFLEQTWCRYVSYKWPSVLHFSSLQRADWATERRGAELERWLAKLGDLSARERILREALEPLYGRIVSEVHAPAALELASFAGAIGEAAPRQVEGPDRANRYVLGTPLRFGRYGTGFHFPASGHHDREEWGVWIDGTFRITLPLAQNDCARIAKLEIAAQHFFSAERARSPMCVSVNDGVVLDIVEDRHGPLTYAVDLSGRIAPDVTALAIEIESLNRASPAALGLGADQRALGVGLIALTLWPR